MTTFAFFLANSKLENCRVKYVEGYKSRQWTLFSCFVSPGLDGTLGGRCILEVPVFHHPTCHHVSMETVGKQPEVGLLGPLMAHQTTADMCLCEFIPPP